MVRKEKGNLNPNLTIGSKDSGEFVDRPLGMRYVFEHGPTDGCSELAIGEVQALHVIMAVNEIPVVVLVDRNPVRAEFVAYFVLHRDLQTMLALVSMEERPKLPVSLT